MMPSMLSAVLGCAVCGAGQEGTDWAYLSMTGVVSLTPLFLIGGICVWLHQASKARALEDAAQAERRAVAANAEASGLSSAR
jgi:3-hydroxyacyl-CoA dehydrogenase